MRQGHRKLLVTLVVLLIATVYGLIRTANETTVPSPGGATADRTTIVDQTSFLTAQGLARMPTPSAELQFAQRALELGDQELDLAFASAVLDATQHPAPLSSEAKAIQSRLREAERALAEQQTEVTRLTAAVEGAGEAQKDALETQLLLAKAQLELSQDEVDDAKQDLIRAGGDLQDRIQAMVQEHEAASHSSDSTRVAITAPVEARGLISRFQQWWTLHRKQQQISHAKEGAVSSAASLSTKHDLLEKQIAAEKEKSSQSALSADSSRENSTAAIKLAQRGSTDRKSLATLDKRIDAEKRLADVYSQWSDVLGAEQRVELNGILRGALAILLVIIAGMLVNDWLRRALGRTSVERRRAGALRTAARVAMQIAGVLVILIVIFGPPTQLGTVLGLVGAGLTVVLKDFILAFIGWFILMGKHGMRLGDWVEIKGVTGEVVEIGIFHTVLLETGNWTDSGHPTGRRVTFANNFAVEGHYFNFSTSGQWMWDELQIVLPAGQNLSPIIDAIQQKVVEATAESARNAEQEWKRSAGSRDMEGLSAAPAMSVKPVIGGTQICVRYVTRAAERSQLRAKLNHAAVDLLGASLAAHRST